MNDYSYNYVEITQEAYNAFYSLASSTGRSVLEQEKIETGTGMVSIPMLPEQVQQIWNLRKPTETLSQTIVRGYKLAMRQNHHKGTETLQ